MALLKLLKYPDPKLRRKCFPVRKETNFKEIQDLINRMFDLMHFYKGIGLAAPQVGVAMRIIIIDIKDNKPLSMINPELIWSLGEVESEEGCLSIPLVSGLVARSNKIKVKYLDYFKQKQEIELEGLKAVCVQHEIEHLDGILYIDHLSRLKQDIIKRKYKKLGFR